jgi:hypothetical protein
MTCYSTRGTPSGSSLDDDSRAVFHNAHEFEALYL